jgi:hypothetical protein
VGAIVLISASSCITLWRLLLTAHWEPRAEKRQAEAARIRDKYPDRIPVSTLCFLKLIGGPCQPHG